MTFKMKAVLVIISVILLGNVLISQAVCADGWEHITEVNGENIGTVFTVETTPEGSIIFGGETGIYEMNGNEITKITDLPSIRFAVDIDGNIYTGAQGWNDDIDGKTEILKFSKNNGTYSESVFFALPDSFPYIKKYAADSQGNVWVTTYLGIYCIDNMGNYQLFDTSNGLYDNYIHDIHIDSSSRVWVCYGDPILPREGSNNFGGVSMYSDDVWTTFNESDGLPSNKVFCIESISTSVFVSYWGANGEISIYINSTWSLAPVSGYFNLCTDNTETLWYHLYHFKDIGFLNNDGSFGTINESMPIVDYYYDLAVDYDGTICVGTTDGILKHPPIITAVESEENKPEVFEVSVYPNPFNPTTTISYTISEPGDVSFSVYNISGQKVAILVDSDMPAGTHHAMFDGSNLASGMYFYRFETENVASNGKMMIVK